jgi:hypothetical protein
MNKMIVVAYLCGRLAAAANAATGVMQRVIGNLARVWEGRIEVQLLGPMAAYDFIRIDSD